MEFMEIISIEFEYRQKNYFALVRIKDKHPKEYHITIMNGSLEQRLYGNHIFIHEDDGIVIDPIPAKDTGDLRLAVGQALCNHFNVPYNSLEKNI
jgi:hypothetical protein